MNEYLHVSNFVMISITCSSCMFTIPEGVNSLREMTQSPSMGGTDGFFAEPYERVAESCICKDTLDANFVVCQLLCGSLSGCGATSRKQNSGFLLDTSLICTFPHILAIVKTVEFKMVSTRAHTQSKDIENLSQAAAGGGIKAPARRGRTKKSESETRTEEKPKAATKNTATKSRTKASAKSELQEEDPPKAVPKTQPQRRSRTAAKPVPEPEVKATRRSTRATPASMDTGGKGKTRQASRTVKMKEEKPAKTVNKAGSKEKPKAPRRRAIPKTQAAEEQKDDCTIADNVPNSEDAPNTGSRQSKDPEGEKTEHSLQNVKSPNSIPQSPPAAPQSSRLPQPASPKKATEQTSQMQLESGYFSPPRSLFKSSAIKLSATVNPLRSSALVSPEKSLGSPRKPPVAAKLLSSPAKTRTCSPSRTSTTDFMTKAASPRQPHFPTRPTLRPVASESQLSASKPLFGPPAPSNRPSTSAGPMSPAKPSLKVAGAPSPKKSVTFHDHRTPGQSPQPQQLAPVALAIPPTPRPSILAGLVFYVDVLDRNGGDARSLFVPLLLDLGARVVPHWASNVDPVTHVLFKDGDLMTLEKVVASNGAVKAVNIGWVLDCEKEGRKMDEAGYLIDLPNVPGLCTPGKLSVCTTPRVARGMSAEGVKEGYATPIPAEPLREIEFPTIAGLRIKTPSFNASMGVASSVMTPFVPGAGMGMGGEDKENVSPTQTEMMETPLHQKSCPAKQANKPLFLIDSAATPMKKLVFGNQKRRETMAPRF